MVAEKFHTVKPRNLRSPLQPPVRGSDALPSPPDEWTPPLSAPDFYEQIVRICISSVSEEAQPMKLLSGKLSGFGV